MFKTEVLIIQIVYILIQIDPETPAEGNTDIYEEEIEN